ncbi:SUMF1/EgtB/PvdO family nonheme iron enzyme [Myxococcota bacterium]|nr:SUMF1/EgtB/PvdO family nonheme iron enzyme [Myxococcota bacterium]
MVRGGSWNDDPRNLRCACRNRNDPRNRNDNLGFRVVVRVPPEHVVPRPAVGASCR